MAFHVRDPATDLSVSKLAKIKQTGLTETAREAVEREYPAITAAPPLVERLRTLQAMRQAGGKPVDKAFFDDLSGH